MKKLNDKERINFLAAMFANCPTATITYKPGDEEHPAYTISVLGVCDPVTVTRRTFRETVDALMRQSK